jgi:hypothetical protein
MTQHKFSTRAAARSLLLRQGMMLNYASPLADLDREYWWYTDGPNAMLDHSATITRIGQTYHVTDFSGRS